MSERKVGVWIIGAFGSIATTVFLGASALRRGLTPSTGMVTELPPFQGLDLVDMAHLELGGCDVRTGDLVAQAHHILRETSCPTMSDPAELEVLEKDLRKLQQRIASGTTCNCGEAILKLAGGATNSPAGVFGGTSLTSSFGGRGQGVGEPPKTHGPDISPHASLSHSLREEIARIGRCLDAFKQSLTLDSVVVVNLASTEPLLPAHPAHESPDALEAALDRNDTDAVRASTLYAYAAIQSGFPYINFTPSGGALLPALIRMAEARGVPVMGNDGKTGETLVKSALAPLFTCRNLEVLSWEGFNILGNMDGSVLDHPANRESKIKTKDGVLAAILGYTPHSRVHIDYVPSLDDQKTAWDFIHFRGFLGAKMSLQFIWQGYDSLLAAPLVLDLARLAELAQRRGEGGLMPHLACFFKAPLGAEEHRLSEQFRLLQDYAENIRQG